MHVRERRTETSGPIHTTGRALLCAGLQKACLYSVLRSGSRNTVNPRVHDRSDHHTRELQIASRQSIFNSWFKPNPLDFDFVGPTPSRLAAQILSYSPYLDGGLIYSTVPAYPRRSTTKPKEERLCSRTLSASPPRSH